MSGFSRCGWGQLVLAGVTLLGLFGCTPGTNPNRPADGEAGAKAVLKTALDSWMFGDTQAKWQKDHLNIQLLDGRWNGRSDVPPVKLVRYEIGTGRDLGKQNLGDHRYEFIVQLTTFDVKGAEQKESVVYRVDRLPDGDQWNIYTR